MYKLNALSAITKMTIKELRDFIYEKYYRQFGILKKQLLFKETPEKKFLFLLATK